MKSQVEGGGGGLDNLLMSMISSHFFLNLVIFKEQFLLKTFNVKKMHLYLFSGMLADFLRSQEVYPFL
jgi:hypothetical protein